MAKFNSKTPAHPLIQGFPTEFVLRHIANHPQSTNDAKNLAVAVLKGHTEALWGLHNELHHQDHPILNAGYNWLNAADKLHLDKHTYTALNEAAERRRAEEPHVEHRVHTNQYLWRYTPEYQAQNATGGITSHSSSRNGQTYANVFNRVKELSPQSTDEEINESIRRHGHRAQQESQRRITGSSPDQDRGNALRHPDQNPKINAISTRNEIATRYKKRPKLYSFSNKSNFIGSLLKASSPEHMMYVNRIEELAHRAGAKRTKQFPALHDTPHQSVPGVALAVYGNIQPNSAHALGSWVNGLLPNSPGYAVFHVRNTGPDTLYRMRMEGSGYDTRAKLDRTNIPSRVFVPHRKGLDILIPDKGNRMSQQVRNFASQQKVPIESSRGHLTTVGSQDQGQARAMFRDKIAKVGMSRRGKPKKYSGETTEEDFHRQLDANPDDHHTRMVFADWLQERDDPRAEGYRALGQLRLHPDLNPGLLHTNAWFWSSDIPSEHNLPEDWWQHSWHTGAYHQHSGIRQSRRNLENHVALAFGQLPKERKHAILNPTQPEKLSRRQYVKRYAGTFTLGKVTKPQSPDTKPKSLEPKYDLPSRAKQDLGSHLTPKPREFQYEPGLLPPTPTTQWQPPKGIQQLPKGVRQKEWNPTMVPPKSPPLFNPSEMNKLHQWAHNHAFTHTPAFAKFLGKNSRDPQVHNLLVKSIVHAAHEMRRTGTNSITAGLGNTGKRIKINIPRTSWVGVKTTPKTYKPPKPKPVTLSRFERRRRTFRGLQLCLS